MSRYRHPASQKTSATVHLDVAARFTLWRATAVPPPPSPVANGAGTSDTRTQHAALLARSAADARACRAVVANSNTLVRVAG